MSCGFVVASGVPLVPWRDTLVAGRSRCGWALRRLAAGPGARRVSVVCMKFPRKDDVSDVPGKVRRFYGSLAPEQQLFVQVLYIFLVVSVMLNVSANTLRLLRQLQLYPFW